MFERAWSPRPPLWARDALLALVITVVQVQVTVARTHADPATVLRPLSDIGYLGYALLVISGLALTVRRWTPVLVFSVTALVSLVYYSLDYPDGPGWLSLFLALYTLTALGDGRRSLLIAGSGISVLAVAWLLAAQNIEPRAAIGWVFFRIGVSIMSAALGESVRSRRVIVADALERAELAERTREEEARARVAQERVRIAREVHDTVAHAIAVINVQAGVTAHVLPQRPDRAREALETIEQTSSRALEEMRAVLDVLRADDDDRAPLPGLDRLDDLVEQARVTGLDVKVEESAPPSQLPGAVSTAAYRILQESITNVIRHAGATRVTVSVRYGGNDVDIHVVDDGGPGRADSATAPGTAAPGRGIRGMRERCELLGGRLDAGPRVGVPGFEVRATLPTTATSDPGPA